MWAPADLADRCIAPPTRVGRDGGDVGVVEHDGGGLAAELQRHPLHLLAADAHDALARRGRPGEGDLVGARVGDEVLADLPGRQAPR